MRVLTLAGHFLLAGSLQAQVHVVPSSLTNLPGPGSTAWPFGLTGPTRVQNFYGSSETGLQGPVLIRSIEVRAEEVVTNGAKSNIALEIEMSTSHVGIGNASTTFANNRGPNHTVVYSRKLTSLNSTSPSPVGQWGGAWMFDAPFPYDPAQGNLLVEYDISSQSMTPWSMDTTGSLSAGAHSNVGTACNGLNASSAGGALGAMLTFNMTGGALNGVALLVLGTIELPVPIPVPGNPPCAVFTDLAAWLVVLLSGTGAGSADLPVPPEASLREALVFGQFASLTPSLNFDTTQARKVVLDGFVAGRIYHVSSNTAPAGTLQLRSAIVVGLGL
jgi:hypothetical protein